MKYIKKEIILEGGPSGHLQHIYDDASISFKEILNIFENVFSGKVELREKIDGFAFSLTMKDGVLYSARNKSELKNPLNLEQTKQKFSDRIPRIKNAFITSFEDMNSALQSLTREQQENIFNDGHNFLSIEIVSPGSKNIIDYRASSAIVLHGIDIFDDNLNKIDTDAEKAKFLFDLFKQNNVLVQSSFEIKGPIVLNIADNNKANNAFSEIKNDLLDLIKPLSLSNTLFDYILLRIRPFLEEVFNSASLNTDLLTTDLISKFISRSKNSLGIPLYNLKTFSKELAELFNIAEKDANNFIKEITNSLEDEINEAMLPVMSLTIKAGILLIDCLDGFLTSSQEETIIDLSNQLDDAINTLSTSELTPNIAKRFATQLKRLEAFNKQVFSTEGVVFTYNDQLYKLTSTFASINQLIGLLYSIIPMKESVIHESTSWDKSLRAVVYIPGSMKPPHIGHAEMIKQYAENNWSNIKNEIHVIISDPKKVKRLLRNKKEITAENSKKALEFILEKINVKNVSVHILNNPLAFIHDNILENIEDFRNTNVIIGLSKKDGIGKINSYNSLINAILKKIENSGINQLEHKLFFINPEITALDPIKLDDYTISATELRNTLSDIVESDFSDKEIVNKLSPFLPNNFTENDIEKYITLLEIF